MTICTDKPAFANTYHAGKTAHLNKGMSTHEYFAAHCPINLGQAVEIAEAIDLIPEGKRDLDSLLKLYADIRVKYADAMINALSGKLPEETK